MTDETERQLRESLQRQADRFEPTSDAQRVIEARIEEQLAANRGGRFEAAPRVLLAAAAVAILVGTAAILTFGQPPQQVEVLSTSIPVTTTAQDGSPETTEVVIVADSPDEDGAGQEAAADDPEPEASFSVLDWSASVGPRAETPELAAQLFLQLIRVEHTSLEISGTDVVVYGSDKAELATLSLAKIPMWSGDELGYAVQAATSEHMTITSPAASSLATDQAIVVEGAGKGWESSLVVSLFSNSDGVVLDRSFPTGGMTESLPFQTELMVAGRDSGWIVLQGSVGADDISSQFAAIPIEWDAGQDPTEFVVSRLPAEDPDGGLNVRDQPGVNVGEVLATLPPGTSGIRRRGRVPANVGDEVWWDVITDEGLNGWVNSRYLVRVGEIDTGALESIGSSFLAGMDPEQRYLLTNLPWSSTKPVQIGTFASLTDNSSQLLRTEEFWATDQTWTLPASLDPSEESSTPIEFFRLGQGSTVMSTSSPDSIDNHSCGSCRSAVEWTFAGLSAVTVGYGGDDFDIDDRVVTLYLEPTAEGPEIVAVAVWVWTP